MRKRFFLQPMEHGLYSAKPSLHQPYNYAHWPTKNIKIKQKSAQKRWGYAEDRDLGAGVYVYDIIHYILKDGTVNTMYLTDGNLCRREATYWSYKTETYTTGTVTDITGTTVTGNGTAWNTEVAAGDYFIMDDDHTATSEPDANWTGIASVTDATHLELDSSYTANGTTYKIRKVYTVPTDERWSWAIVDDKLCFTNGNTNVQYWDGADYAEDLDSTNAIKARYCIEYANRLILADEGSTRNPVLVKWSKNGDPTDWTDATAGEVDLFETKDIITGLGKVGANLIIYKDNSIVIGNRTGIANSPIEFSRYRQGIGLAAPWSIVEAMGTNFFLGRNDFYMMDGDMPRPVGEPIRDLFFEVISETEIEKVVGFPNHLQDEAVWLANTSNGLFAFVLDYKTLEWYPYQYANEITTGGIGEST